MFITEYAELAVDKKGNPVPVGKEGGSTIYQQITYTATHGASAAFGKGTNFVRITLDAAGYVKFGGTPVAVTATHTPMQANTPEYFGVEPEQKVSAVV